MLCLCMCEHTHTSLALIKIVKAQASDKYCKTNIYVFILKTQKCKGCNHLTYKIDYNGYYKKNLGCYD